MDETGLTFERLPSPVVLLAHEMPDGSSHVDWLLASDPDGRQPLVSFRLDQRLDLLKNGAGILADRIADHRPRYLAYEGEISGNRGRVRQLCRGELLKVHASSADASTLDMHILWYNANPRVQHVRLSRYDKHAWHIACVGSAPGEVPIARATKDES